MARSDRSPQMRERWRAEDGPRDRRSRRDRDRSAHRNRSPSPRRSSPQSHHRGRDLIDEYRPATKHQPSREPRQYRRFSPSPSRSFHSHHPRSRPLDERITRPRDWSPERAAKRRRTESPSPARSDRWVPETRRRSRSRDRYEPRGPPPIDRAFSPRRSSPVRSPRRELPPDIDSYVPHRRREPTPAPSWRRERRSRSPPRRQSPRRTEQKRQPQERQLSPFSARVQRTRELEAEIAKTSAPPSNAASVFGEDESMDYHTRGYGHRGGWNQNRPQRPYVDTRQHQYGGSPPYQGQNGSYHSSPHSASPHYNRGGWNGPQGHQR